MNDTDERVLSEALNELAGHGPSTRPPTSDLISRGRRRRHARSAVGCAVAVTGAGVVAALATAGPQAGTSPATAAGAHGGTSPAPIALSLAASRTDAGPYHFSLTAKTIDLGRDGKSKGQTRTSTTEGAFDPTAVRGWVKADGGGERAETITIGDTCYAQPVAGGPWLTFACAAPSGTPTLASLTQDPAADLKQLEADGLATYEGRSGSGSGAVDTWKFTITDKSHELTSGASVIGYTAAGTATVGVKSGQVSAIDLTVTLAPNRVIADSVTDVSITFSDYGVPVDVSAPVSK